MLTYAGYSQDEDHNDSAKMSREFLELKRDIEAFSGRLDVYVVETGTQLAEAAEVLQAQIRSLQDQISV